MSRELMSYGELMSGGTNVLDSDVHIHCNRMYMYTIHCTGVRLGCAGTIHRSAQNVNFLKPELPESCFPCLLPHNKGGHCGKKDR